jgi:hypothetical protein
VGPSDNTPASQAHGRNKPAARQRVRTREDDDNSEGDSTDLDASDNESAKSDKVGSDENEESEEWDAEDEETQATVKKPSKAMV